MKANYTPPKGVVQLTYNVSLQEITRLTALDERSKVIDEIPFQATIKISCSKQSDINYKKWDCDLTSTYILNFYHKRVHVYMKLKNMTKMFDKRTGIYYKILTSTIKELPK